MRGFWFGYIEGLYNVKSAQISDDCLSHDISTKLARIITEATSGNVIQLFQLMTDSATIIANLDSCGLEQSVVDVESYCAAHDCSLPAIVANLSSNVF
jgi:hypothetical protein